MAKTSVTPIEKYNMKAFRADVTKALSDVMAKHGLRVQVGNIRYQPGDNFRFRVTVVQPMADVKQTEMPVVGQTWLYNNKRYKITEVGNTYAIGERAVALRGRNAQLARAFGGVLPRVRSYRIPLTSLVNSGTRIS